MRQGEHLLLLNLTAALASHLAAALASHFATTTLAAALERLRALVRQQRHPVVAQVQLVGVQRLCALPRVAATTLAAALASRLAAAALCGTLLKEARYRHG